MSAKKPYSVRGASMTKGGMLAQLGAWWAHHQFTLVSSLSRIWQTPLQALMTSLVVAIALALPATLLIAMHNFQQLGNSWDADPKISVFVNPLAKEDAIAQLRKTVEAWPQVAVVEYLSADQALRDFQEQSGFGDALAGLDENPLPPTLIITLSRQSQSPTDLERLGAQLQTHGIVELVHYDLDWVKGLQALVELGKKVILGLAVLLCLGVLLAIGNTIRLEIENRKEEIIVTKLVGGTDAFVRRPFLYAGAWYGFWGGVFAVMIVAIGMHNLQGAVRRLAESYGSQFVLGGLGLEGGLFLLMVSSSLGFLGAWLAVTRHLNGIKPS